MKKHHTFLNKAVLNTILKGISTANSTFGIGKKLLGDKKFSKLQKDIINTIEKHTHIHITKNKNISSDNKNIEEFRKYFLEHKEEILKQEKEEYKLQEEKREEKGKTIVHIFEFIFLIYILFKAWCWIIYLPI